MKTLINIVKSMRPRQWTKNAFVLAALVFDHKLFDASYVAKAAFGFAIFCIASGLVYILNDCIDKDEDAKNPRKARRPIASGELNVSTVSLLATIFMLMLLTFLFILPGMFSTVVIAYILLQGAYTLCLKRVAIVDVFVIAMGFVLRVAAGMALVDAENFSPWLLACVFFLALFLGLGKRYAESINGSSQSDRDRNYADNEFVRQLLNISATMTVVMYSVYTIVAANLPSNQLALGTVIFVVYGIFRYLYLVHVEKMRLAPDEALLKDRALQIAIGLWGVSILAILYL